MASTTTMGATSTFTPPIVLPTIPGQTTTLPLTYPQTSKTVPPPEPSTTKEMEFSTVEITTEGKETTPTTRPTTRTTSSQPPEGFESTTAESTTMEEDLQVNALIFCSHCQDLVLSAHVY